MEMNLHTAAAQSLYGFGRKLAPGQGCIIFLFLCLKFLADFYQFVAGLRLQVCHLLLYASRLGQYRSRLAVHRLGRAGDIHHAHLGQVGEEFLLVCTEQDKGIFGHSLYHSCSSSSSAAWRVLTIFWEALEIFSSSSINLLILRIAS